MLYIDLLAVVEIVKTGLAFSLYGRRCVNFQLTVSICVGVELNVEFAASISWCQQTEINIFIIFHRILAELFLYVLNSNRSFSLLQNKICIVVDSRASRVALRVNIGFDFSIADSVVSVEIELFFLEVIFQIDQKLFGLIFGQQNVDFMFDRYLNVIIGGHYAEMSIDCWLVPTHGILKGVLVDQQRHQNHTIRPATRL